MGSAIALTTTAVPLDTKWFCILEPQPHVPSHMPTPFLSCLQGTQQAKLSMTTLFELSHNCTLKLCSAAVKQPVHDCMHQTRLDAEVLTQGWPLEPLHPRSLKCHDRACRAQSPRCDRQAFAFGASMCSNSAQTETADQDETATICHDHQSNFTWSRVSA